MDGMLIMSDLTTLEEQIMADIAAASDEASINDVRVAAVGAQRIDVA